ncbi:MAG: pyridoxal phosphate-dependent aminotransferase [Bryobacterales bacterium]|nr:pyridoxal phosphate-dependent aminotransferase [Bryobacterales bacterium]
MQPPARLSQRICRIRVSATMQAAAEAARLRAQGVDVVDFGPGEPDYPTPAGIKAAAVRAIEQDFTRYTAAGGTEELREAICRRHAADFGTGYTAPECAVSSGGKHALFNVLQALVDPGEEVVVPVPYWTTFTDIVAYCGGVCTLAHTEERDHFAITAGVLESHISPKTRAVILNSPCNPSGDVISPEEWGRIHRLTSERGVWLITDECYQHLVYDGVPFSAASLPGARENVVVAGSLSKSYAMTGWRIGFVLGPPAVVSAVAKLQSQSTSNPNSIAQKAAVEAMLGPQDFRDQMLSEYRLRRDFALGRLRAMPGVSCHEPKGAFYLYPDIREVLARKRMRDGMEFANELLRRHAVAIVPGEAFGTPGYIRITFAVSMRDLERGLDRFERFISEQAE